MPQHIVEHWLSRSQFLRRCVAPAHSRLRRRSLVVVLACFAAHTVPAQTALFGFTSGNGSGTVRSDGPFTIGVKFTVGSQALSVTALGVWDQNQNGLAASHDVGLWQSGNSTALSTVTVPSGTTATLTGAFRYITLGTPITLSANTTYILGAFYSTGEAFLDQGTNNASYASAFSSFFAAYSLQSSLSIPTVFPGAPGYVGPNLLYSAIPEPATNALASGIVAAALAAWRGSRKRRGADRAMRNPDAACASR